MDKEQFLIELEKNLKRLPKKEREKFITYYDEMIADHVETGMSEAAAVQKIGLPLDIARELLAEADTIMIPFPKINNKYLIITFLILGFPLWGSLLMAAILLVICIYLVLLCIPFATGVTTVAFLITSLVSIIGSPFIFIGSLSVGLTQLGLGIISFGISALAAYLTITLTKQILPAIIKFTNYLYHTVKGVKL